MSDTNAVVVVSDKQEFLSQISSKLVLLRNIDKVRTSTVEEARNMFCGFIPNVLILHCFENNPHILSLIKFIKNQEIYKHLSILLINENCSRETIIEAFDLGVEDILFAPVIDYELLIRVIWCLKRNETSINQETKSAFLAELGIMTSFDGVYSQKYCFEFLKNEIAQTRKYSQRACILLISLDKKSQDTNDSQDFIPIIRNSIRLNDSIVIKDENKFYVYLQKTKLNGAYSVFERINMNLGSFKGANAGVVEIQDQKFEDIIEALDAALNKANENTNSLIVASDFYEDDNKQQIQTDKIDKIQKQINEIAYADSAKPEQTKKLDTNSIKLFNQTYQRKIKVVVEPIFKKFESILRTKQQDFAINSYVGNKSVFSVSFGELSASFSLEYNGVDSVAICLVILDNEHKRLFETEKVDFTILDYRKVSLMLGELIDKFFVILKSKN